MDEYKQLQRLFAGDLTFCSTKIISTPSTSFSNCHVCAHEHQEESFFQDMFCCKTLNMYDNS